MRYFVAKRKHLWAVSLTRCSTSNKIPASLIKGAVHHEANIPTEPKQAENMSWVSQANEHGGRAKSHQTSASEGPSSLNSVSAAHKARSKTTTGSIKQSGTRVSRGAWTIYAAPSAGVMGRLITAPAKTAGGSVTRSRVRRIARDVFETMRETRYPLDMLLLARANVELEPRRRIRKTLQDLMVRAAQTLAQTKLAKKDNGV